MKSNQEKGNGVTEVEESSGGENLLLYCLLRQLFNWIAKPWKLIAALKYQRGEGKKPPSFMPWIIWKSHSNQEGRQDQHKP